MLFLGFSLDDPFITAHIEYLYDLYNGYGSTHFIVFTSPKDLTQYHVKTIQVDNWNESFSDFLNELIELKKNTKKAVKPVGDTIEDVDINTIEDISILESIYEAKIKEANQSSINEESRKATKETFRIKDRIVELQTKKLLNLGKQLSIPDLDLQELEHLFEVIYSTPKLSSVTKSTINNFKDQHNTQYKWYHRSTIVSALACSIVNHKELDPAKIDFLIDFANEAEEKVWPKAITYLFLVLNHLGNKWLRFPTLYGKLKRLKENPELQQALKEIIAIIQFEFQSISMINKQVFEHEYFKNNSFHYFIPFYENNPSIDKLYDRNDIEEIDNFIEVIYKIPLPDSIKYLICNNENIKLVKKGAQDRSEETSSFSKLLALHNRFEPFLNIINSFISFYKNVPDQQITLNEKLSLVSVKNFKEHLLNTIESYRAMGIQFMLKNDWDTAITNWNALLKISPDDREALLYLVQCLENTEKQINEQLKIRKRIEILLPKNDENLFKIGIIKSEFKDYKDALLYYNKAIDIKPNNFNYYHSRAFAKRELKNHEGALSDYDKAIEINSKDASFYNNRAITKRELKDHEGALSDYDKAIEIDSRDASFYNNRAVTKRELKNYEGALSDYDKAIKINPNNANYYYNRGIAKRDLKDYKGTLSDYTKAIEINPKDADYYYNRAVTKGNLKDYEGALTDYSKAIEINPKDTDYYYNRAIIKGDLKDYEGALSDCSKAIEINPKDADIYNGKSSYLRILNNFNEAHKSIDISIQLNPAEGRYHGTKAAIFSSENNEESFYEYLEVSFRKGAKAAWLDEDIKEKYRNEVRFQDLLQKYNLTLDEE